MRPRFCSPGSGGKSLDSALVVCYNLFKFTFDTKLQNEMVEVVRYRAPSLVQQLAARPKGEATFREAEIIIRACAITIHAKRDNHFAAGEFAVTKAFSTSQIYTVW